MNFQLQLNELNHEHAKYCATAVKRPKNKVTEIAFYSYWFNRRIYLINLKTYTLIRFKTVKKGRSDTI